MLVGLVLTATCFGCAKKPAPPPVVPTPAASAAPEPPPPKKCEALDEACISTDDTRTPIPGSGLAFRPPVGWTYAKETTATVAQKDPSALVVVAREVKVDPKKKKAPPVPPPLRADALEAVVKRLDVTFPGKKGKPKLGKKPDREEKVGDRKALLFQLDGAQRQGKKGPLLVFETRDDAGALVLGAAFVAEDDTTNADAEILKAIASLAPAGAGSTP